MELFIIEKVFICAYAIFALAKFLDKFHFAENTTKQLIGFTRNSLISGFVFLDEINPTNFSKWLFRFPRKITFPIYALSFLFLYFLYPILHLIALTMIGALFPIAFLFFACCSLTMQVVVFAILRIASRKFNDHVCTAILLITPILLWSPFYFLSSFFNSVPNIAGLGFAILVAMAGFASLIPALLILFLFLFVMIIKFMTSTLRWLALHIISAATDPKTDPFTYAAALSVLLITLNRAIFEILSQ